MGGKAESSLIVVKTSVACVIQWEEGHCDKDKKIIYSIIFMKSDDLNQHILSTGEKKEEKENNKFIIEKLENFWEL